MALASLLLSLGAAEVGLRLYEAWRLASGGTLRDQLERSRRTSLDHAGAGGSFRLGGLVQPSYHGELVFELKPRLDGYFKGGTLRTNSWGFRGPELELEKRPGTRRIVGLGDSFMFGWGVNQDETYLVLLEEALNARGGPRFEVLNLAVPGYNTTMEVEAFATKGVAFEPDLVLIHFFLNDVGLPYFMQEPREKPAERQGLYLIDLARRAFGLAPRPEPALQALLPHDRVARQQRTEVQEAYRHMVGDEAYRLAMARLAGLAAELSIPVVVILLEGDDPTDGLVREVAAAEGLYLLEPRARFLAHLRANRKDESQWGETFHVSEKDVHLNKLGHALMAEALLDLFAEEPELAEAIHLAP